MEKEKKEKKEKKGKIKPNEIYIINKLNFANQAKVLAKICMTLKYAKKEPLDPDIFIKYVTEALAFGRCIILVTFNKDMELNGCVVLLLNNNRVKGKILWIEWAWSDGKDLKLGLKLFKKIEELAQILKADRIAGAMTRGFRAVLKRYGLKEAYRVIEKKVNKDV